MNNKPTTAEIIILAAGAVALICSFLGWFGSGSFSVSAWDSGLFPIATYVGIFGAVMAVVVALEVFASVSLPAKILSFNWPQIHLALAVFCALIALGYFIVDTGGGDKGAGLMLSVLAAAGLVTGAIMLDKERPGGVRVAPAAGAAPPMAPPPPPPPPA